MISIRKSVSDLERLDELEKRERLASTILECYALAIDSSAHYAVEIDAGLAAELRSHLQIIGDQSRKASSADEVRSVQASFRGELRDYRDRSAEQLKKMRKEIENASAAMMVFADTVATNGSNHEKELHSELQGLESKSKSNSLVEIRAGIGTAVAGIETSVQQMQRSNQMVIAQLQDEIRVLHQQIDQERKALFTDRASGAWNRQKIDIHIDNLLRQNQPFCLLLVSLRNFKHLNSQHSRTVVEGTLQALTARFRALTGDEAVIGRWTQDQFVAVLDMTPSSAIHLSSDAATKLSGAYSVQENGLAQRVTLHATAGIIDRASGADPSKFRQKLDQLAGAISGA